MRKPIENNSRLSDWIYDPFVGSGTTILAAEITKRRCVAVEIEPAYVDVSVQRWEKYAERQARLEATGETFETVRAQRAGNVDSDSLAKSPERP
jgi:DNA modification methylase